MEGTQGGALQPVSEKAFIHAVRIAEAVGDVATELRTVAVLFALLLPVGSAGFADPELLRGPGGFVSHHNALSGHEDAGAPWAPSDTTDPMIEITSPRMGTILEVPTLTMTGIASDDVALSKVEASVDGKVWFLVNGTSPWSITLVLAKGGNWVSALATDTADPPNWNRTGVWVEVVERTAFERVVLPAFLGALPVVAFVGLVADVVIWRRRMRISRERH